MDPETDFREETDISSSGRKNIRGDAPDRNRRKAYAGHSEDPLLAHLEEMSKKRQADAMPPFRRRIVASAYWDNFLFRKDSFQIKLMNLC